MSDMDIGSNRSCMPVRIDHIAVRSLAYTSSSPFGGYSFMESNHVFRKMSGLFSKCYLRVIYHDGHIKLD
jgi:hypothetical protein